MTYWYNSSGFVSFWGFPSSDQSSSMILCDWVVIDVVSAIYQLLKTSVVWRTALLQILEKSGVLEFKVNILRSWKVFKMIDCIVIEKFWKLWCWPGKWIYYFYCILWDLASTFQPDRVRSSFVIFYIQALWRCPYGNSGCQRVNHWDWAGW